MTVLFLCLSKIYLLEIHSTVLWSEVMKYCVRFTLQLLLLVFILLCSIDHGRKWCYTILFSRMSSISSWPSDSSMYYSLGNSFIGCFSLMFTPYCLHHWGYLEQTSSPQHVFPRAPWLQRGAFPSHTQGRWTACTLEFSTALVTCKPWQHDCLLFLCKPVWIKLTASVWMETTNIANIQI